MKFALLFLFLTKDGVKMGMSDPALYWLIIGVMLVFLQLAVPGYVLSFFGFGALATAFVGWLSPVSIAWQLVLFVSTSIIPLFGFKNIIQNKYFISNSEEEVEGEEGQDLPFAVSGEKGVVSQTITPPVQGQIKYSGTFWRASADERIEEGEIISIVCQKGLVMHVEKV